jgi:SAM-dependent methyltransferase
MAVKVFDKSEEGFVMNSLGPERYQSDRFIRKLLHLADATNMDIFYDLGCGIGQLCVVAVSEFGVRKAVGIESHKGRAKKAEKRVKELSLEDRIEIRNEDFWESDISEATIAYYGLTESDEDVPNCEKKLSAHCRLITLFHLFVGVLPKDADYPFYLMQLPFTKTKSASLWISKVLFKEATLEELYQEFNSDQDYQYDKVTFKRLVKKRLLEK